MHHLGRSLSMFSGSTMQVNPDIDECFALRGWYDNTGAEQTFKAHSNSGGGSSMYGFKREEIRSLDEVKQVGYGMPDKPENFSARATIMHIKSDNISYPACPTANCNKKVVEMGDTWRCEKCSQNFDAPEHRYVLIYSFLCH
jgi:replication factor A1